MPLENGGLAPCHEAYEAWLNDPGAAYLPPMREPTCGRRRVTIANLQVAVA